MNFLQMSFNNTNICKAHIVSIRAESEAPIGIDWSGFDYSICQTVPSVEDTGREEIFPDIVLDNDASQVCTSDLVCSWTYLLQKHVQM